MNLWRHGKYENTYILLTLAEGTDFPYTDRPRPVNNMFIFVSVIFLVFKMIRAYGSANSLCTLHRTVTL